MAMASPSTQTCLFFLLLTLTSSSLMHTYARDSQFFNKVPSTTNTNFVPTTNEPSSDEQQQQDPTFLPDNENGYGLYGHESGQLPPSAAATTTTTAATTESKRPLSKYLPKNYNPVAYVTEPENINDIDTNTDTDTFSDDKSFSTTTNPYTNTYNDGGRSYYNNQQDEDTDQYKSFSSATNNYSYYTGGSSFNSQPLNGGATLSSRDTTFNYGGAGELDGFRPQGMSDTRSLANGKYFYDVNTERYNTNHPYESLKNNGRSRDVFGNRNNYGNSEINAYEFNNGNSNQDEFQEQQNYNLP